MNDRPPPLWEHQGEAVKFLRKLFNAGEPGGLLAMEMGTGKTRAALEFIAHEYPPAARILILAPLTVVRVWNEEIEKFWRGDEPVVYMHEGGSAAKSAQKAADAFHRARTRPFFLVINYESMSRPNGAMRKLVTQMAPFHFYVADEGHRLKAPSGKTSRALAAIAKKGGFRITLTGTPIPQSILDAYGLMRFTHPGVFGTSFQKFQHTYTRPAITAGERRQGDSFPVIEQGGVIRRYIPKNTDDFEQRMRYVTYRVKSGDVLDLPDSVDQFIPISLSREATRIYGEMEDEFVAEVKAGLEITAANAAVKVMRLQQITSGIAPEDEQGFPLRISDAKMKALADLLDDLPSDEPVVVFTRFKMDVEQVREVVEKGKRGTFGQITGQGKDIDAFKRGDVRVLAVNPQSGGFGISLVRARYAVWYALPWSLAQYDQARARLVRFGQERSVTFAHLIAIRDRTGESTIDGQMARALRERSNMIEALMDSIAHKLGD